MERLPTPLEPASGAIVSVLSTPKAAPEEVRKPLPESPGRDARRQRVDGGAPAVAGVLGHCALLRLQDADAAAQRGVAV
jgi:hypothetical protein